VGAVLHESGERRSGWRVWLRRAAHHFLPEDQTPAKPPAKGETAAAAGDARVSSGRGGPGAPGDEHPGGTGRSGGADPSLDHVLRSAAEARAMPERDQE
jgi:hypothetical protein